MLLEPIIECVYGWGQVMRLYDDHLDIGGTSYLLIDLIAIHSNYYYVLGVPSVRLELCFKYKRVVLRGIAAIEIAQRTASYLSAFCRLQTPDIALAPVDTGRVNQPQWIKNVAKEHRQTDDILRVGMIQPVTTETVARARITDDYNEEPRKKFLAFKMPRWQLIGHEQRQRRMKRLQAERARREHGFDVEQLVQRLQAETLPQVYVPTRLLAGESAHYCTNTTLCEEPLSGATQSRYTVKDQGMLILTDRRMIYIGRRRQLVLDYSRLLHVSRLPGAIAVLSESWAQRELFEVPFPLECTMYLDAILLRSQKRAVNERTHARVRQLYPSTQTSSYDTHKKSDYETQARWRSTGFSNK
jgi:hypothetical protein